MEKYGPKTGAVSTQRLIVSNYEFPAVDSSAVDYALFSDGVGQLYFGPAGDISGLVGGAGTGVDDRVARWDGSENIQSSTVTLTDAGAISGITDITATGTPILSGLTYPTSDGTNGQYVSTDGAGSLTFTSVGDASGVIGGAGLGVDNQIVRWDGSENIQSSVVNITDGGNVWGIVDLSVAGSTIVNNFTTVGTTIINGITYPASDGTSGQVFTTDGAGSGTFTSVGDASGVIGGAGVGVDNRIVRWDGTEDIQSSLVVLTDTGDMSGVVDLGTSGASSISNTGTNTVSTGGAVVASTGTNTASTNGIVLASSGTSNAVGGNSAIIASGLLGTTSVTAPVSAIIACGDPGSNTITGLGAGVIMGTIGSSISQQGHSSIISSANCLTDGSGLYHSIIGSKFSSMTSNAGTSVIISGDQASIHGTGGFSNNNAIVACQSATMDNMTNSCIIGSDNAGMNLSTNRNNVILGSSLMNNSGLGLDNVVYGGVGSRTWLIDSNTGIYYGGNAAINTSVPDYAEYFENLSIGEIPVGSLVTMDTGKIRAANLGDKAFGVVSGNPSVILGAAQFEWQGRIMKDEWNRVIKTMQPKPGWIPNAELGETEEDHPLVLLPKINPDFDPSKPYVSRESRPDQWTKVGLMGQILTRIDDTIVAPNMYIKSDDGGIGTLSTMTTKIKVMKITQPFDHNKGYGIALCLYANF